MASVALLEIRNSKLLPEQLELAQKKLGTNATQTEVAKILEWVCGALVLDQKKANGIVPRENFSYWRVLSDALKLPTVKSVALSKKITGSTCQAIAAVARTDELLDSQELVQELHNVLSETTASISLIAKASDANEMFVSLTQSNNIFSSHSGISFACSVFAVYLEATSAIAPRKRFESFLKDHFALLLKFRYRLLDFMQKENSSSTQSAATVLLGLINRSFSVILFAPEVVESYVGVCDNASVLLGLKEGSVSSRKRPRKSGKNEGDSGASNKLEQHSFLRQLFVVLSEYLSRKNGSVDDAHAGQVLSFLSVEFARVIKQVGIRHESTSSRGQTASADNENQTTATGKRSRQPENSIQSFRPEFVFWLELVQVSTVALKGARKSSGEAHDQLAALLRSALDASLYRVSDRKAGPVCDWFRALVQAWQAQLEDRLDEWRAAEGAAANQLVQLFQGQARAVLALLALDHQIVEPRLLQLFAYFSRAEHAVVAQSSAEGRLVQLHSSRSTSSATVALVSSVCAVYAKMRRMSVAIDAISDCCEANAVELRALLVKDGEAMFESTVSEVFVEVPGGQLNQIWQCLLSAVQKALEMGTEALRGSHLYLVNFMFVLFVENIRVTQYNAKKVCAWATSTVEQVVSRAVAAVHGNRDGSIESSLFVTATIRLIQCITSVFRLGKAWSYDARPTTVAAIFGSETPNLENAQLQNAYSKNLLAPFTTPDSQVGEKITISRLVKVVKKLSPQCFTTSTTDSKSSELQLLDLSIKSLMMSRIHHLFEDFYRYSVLSGAQNSDQSGAFKEAQKHIDLLCNLWFDAPSTAKAFETRDLIVLGKMASEQQVYRILERLMEGAILVVDTSGESILPDGHPLSHPMFYEVDTFQRQVPLVLGNLLRASFMQSFKISSQDNSLEPSVAKSARKPKRKGGKKAKVRPSGVAEGGLLSVLAVQLEEFMTPDTDTEHSKRDAAESVLNLLTKHLEATKEEDFGSLFQLRKLAPAMVRRNRAVLQLVAAIPENYFPSDCAVEVFALVLVFAIGEVSRCQTGKENSPDSMIAAMHCVNSMISQYPVECTGEWPITGHLSLLAQVLESFNTGSMYQVATVAIQTLFPYCTPRLNDTSQQGSLESSKVITEFITKRCNAKGNQVWRVALAQFLHFLVEQPTLVQSFVPSKRPDSSEKEKEQDRESEERTNRVRSTMNEIALESVKFVDSNLRVVSLQSIPLGDSLFAISAALLTFSQRHPEAELESHKGILRELRSTSKNLFEAAISSVDVNECLEQDEKISNSMAFVAATCANMRRTQSAPNTEDVKKLFSSVLHAASRLRGLHKASTDQLAIEIVLCIFRECSNSQLLVILQELEGCLRSATLDALGSSWVLATVLPILTIRRQALAKEISAFAFTALQDAVSLCRFYGQGPCRHRDGDPISLVYLIVSAMCSWKRGNNKTSSFVSQRDRDIVNSSLTAVGALVHGLEQWDYSAVNARVQSVVQASGILFLLVRHFSLALYSSASAFTNILLLLEKSVLQRCSSTGTTPALPFLCLEEVSRVFEELENHKPVFRHHASSMISALLRTYENPGVSHLAEHTSQRIANYLFALCSKYELQQLHASLPLSAKAMFRTLHLTFEQQHKFKGKT